MTSPTNDLVRLLDRTRGDGLQAIAHIVIALLRAADLRSRPLLVDSLHEQVDTMPMVFRDVRTNEKRRYSRGPGPPNHLKIDLWKAPPILIIHFKRFRYTSDFYREKIEEFVDFPTAKWSLKPHIRSPQRAWRASWPSSSGRFKAQAA